MSTPRSPSRSSISSVSSASTTASSANTKGSIGGKPTKGPVAGLKGAATADAVNIPSDHHESGSHDKGPHHEKGHGNDTAHESKTKFVPVPDSGNRMKPTIGDSHISMIHLLPCAKIFFTCFANASYKQRITLKDKNDKELGVFEGNGENEPMLLVSKKGLAIKDKEQKVLALPMSFKIRECKVEFEHHNGTENKHSRALAPVTVGDRIIRTISINATENKTSEDFCDSQLKCDMIFPDIYNQTTILIPEHSDASISFMANALHEQHAICWIDDEMVPFTFSGNGENKAMVSSDRTSELHPHVTLTHKSYDRYLTAIFLYVNGEKKTKQSRAGEQVIIKQKDTGFRSVTVSAEDTETVRKDMNDTVLRVVAVRHDIKAEIEEI